ncbi:MAG: hypothetical protein SFV51_30285 [Bryobacteraceae bacterium]|nr:hypothetical protein [Bryobacteraceae bacterium]
MEELAAAPAAEDALRLPPLEEERSRLVADRSALAEERTPPVDAPPPELIAELVEPPVAAAPIADDVLATVALVADVPEVPEVEDPDEDPPEEEPPELDPPELELPPRERPMNAPPPPEKLRLPRSCGPRMLTNRSGPVWPLSRSVSCRRPEVTFAVRVACATRFCAKVSSAR